MSLQGLLSTEAGTVGRVVGDVFISYFAGLIFVQQNPIEIVNFLYVPLGLILLLNLGLVSAYYDLLEA